MKEAGNSRARNTIQTISMIALTSMAFSGALLLFGIEPLVGRLLTPFFGSAAHVWLICLMFFQAMLFIGYLYSHLFAKKLGGRHLLLLLLPLVSLPLKIDAAHDPSAPLSSILSALILNAALPFIVLSTTAVVAQSWFSDSSLGKEHNPYPLYAASNAGSLSALLGYTFLIEPLMGLQMQSLVWTGCYFVYAIIVITVWIMLRPKNISTIKECRIDQINSQESISRITYLKWFMLSILPSALLLAVTNFITLEVGSFPLMWIAPLALYLASFMITFRMNGGVPKYLNIIWPEILLFCFVLFLSGAALWVLILGHLLLFFLICLIANGTLYELRPPASRLTTFYLTSALGGWIGGALVTLIAPFAFTGLYEYPITLLAIGVTLFVCHPGTFKTFMPGTPIPIFCTRLTISMILLSIAWLGIGFFLGDDTTFRYRNFYGTYKINEIHPVDGLQAGQRRIFHGNTMHGAQFLDPQWRSVPLAYYYLGGGISDVFTSTPSPRNIAVLGLGAGGTAPYVGVDDTVTYYEIDPDNEKIARHWFTFLDDCKGHVRVVVGDGRLSLQKVEVGNPKYNIIVIDAFTGDGIPVHLLTQEAIAIYLKRLADDGLILFHISNRYYDLRPVIKATAQQMKLFAATNVPVRKENLKYYELSPKCVVLAKSVKSMKPLLDRGWMVLNDNDRLRKMHPWTDDYINILDPLIEKIRLDWHVRFQG